MAIIKDNKGTEWELKLSLSAIRSICKKLNISLAQLTMLDLPIADVLSSIHYLCAKQLDKEKVSLRIISARKATPAEIAQYKEVNQ